MVHSGFAKLVQEGGLPKGQILLVGTDKGLCGPLNANAFRLAAEFDPATTVFITAGKRASQFVAHTVTEGGRQ